MCDLISRDPGLLRKIHSIEKDARDLFKKKCFLKNKIIHTKNSINLWIRYYLIYASLFVSSLFLIIKSFFGL